MSKTRGKQDKDTSTSTASVTMVEISSLLDEHRQALATDFKSSFNSLKLILDSLHTTVTDHVQWIGSLEENTTEVDHRLQLLNKLNNEMLKAKVADLEGCSRRQNIRIIGLPESTEGPRPSAFFSQLLVDILCTNVISSLPEIDQAHRSLTTKPAAGQRPQPVIIRFDCYQTKDLVICEGRRRRDLFHKEHKIRFYDDYRPHLLKQRAEYKNSMAELYKRRYKPALLNPAKLRITHRPTVRRNGSRPHRRLKSLSKTFIQTRKQIN